MGESGEAPRVERPGTPSPLNTGNTKWVPFILPMGESGEAPRVERPGTPSPLNTGNTKCVAIITPATPSVLLLSYQWVRAVRRPGGKARHS